MAEAFFHRKTAVFHYFQLAIEILARTRMAPRSLNHMLNSQSLSN